MYIIYIAKLLSIIPDKIMHITTKNIDSYGYRWIKMVAVPIKASQNTKLLIIIILILKDFYSLSIPEIVI